MKDSGTTVLVSFYLMLIFVSSQSAAAFAAIVPEKSVIIVKSDMTTPVWQALWQRAREQVRSKHFAEAAEGYAELVKIKPNIEEANWEYSKLLLKLGEYKIGTRIIASLLENNGNKIDYLFAAGKFALLDKDWIKTVRYFGRVLENDPSGEYSQDALNGMILGLKNSGKGELAKPIEERSAGRLRQIDEIDV